MYSSILNRVNADPEAQTDSCVHTDTWKDWNGADAITAVGVEVAKAFAFTLVCLPYCVVYSTMKTEFIYLYDVKDPQEESTFICLG